MSVDNPNRQNIHVLSDVGHSDPTVQLPAAPPVQATGHWNVSLAEIDAMCRKAARGASYDWGLAEEAGHAARTLAAWGLPGPDALLAVLQSVDGRPRQHAPSVDDSVRIAHEQAVTEVTWQPRGAVELCPVATGIALSDRAEQLRAGMRVTLGPVLAPLLLLPFLYSATRYLGSCCQVTHKTGTLLVTPDGPEPRQVRLPARLESLHIAIDTTEAKRKLAAPADNADPLSVTLTTWRELSGFAMRTCVPASEASRAGAGSEGNDND